MKKRSCILAVVTMLTVFVAIGVLKISSYAYFMDGKMFLSSGFLFFSRNLFIKSNWVKSGVNEGERDCTWVAENAYIKDDNLVLTVDNDENGIKGGEIYSFQKYGYGLYQVSMKPIKNSGVVSAFFNYGKDDKSDNATEIDIEFLGYDTTKVQFNYYTNGVGNHEYLYDLGFDASEGFHTYAFYWSSDSIIWYVDGVQVHEANTDIPQYEAAISMDAWAGGSPSWVGEYDGNAPLSAYYQWVSYDKEGK